MNRRKRLFIELTAAALIGLLITLFFPPSQTYTAHIKNYYLTNSFERELEGDELTAAVNAIRSAEPYSGSTDEAVFTYDYGMYLNDVLFLVSVSDTKLIQNSETGLVFSLNDEHFESLKKLIDSKDTGSIESSR